MLWVVANNADDTSTSDYFTLVTNWFDTCSYFHSKKAPLDFLRLALPGFHATVMMVHLHHSVELSHCIEVNTDKDDQGCSAKQHGNWCRKLEDQLNQSRNQSDECQEDCARKDDSVEDLCKVFLKLLISDARNGTAVVPDVLAISIGFKLICV